MERSARVLADLRRRYYLDSRAHEGQELLDGYRAAEGYEDLAWLLRHHGEARVENDETWDRDAVDELLNYYAVLEVASVANVIGDLPRSEAAQASETLGDVIIRVYYEENYPLTLPGMFRERLLGTHAVSERHADSLPMFYRFLALNQGIENDAVDDFLWFIDGGVLGGKDIDSVLEILDEPAELDRRLRVSPRNRTRLDNALVGMQSFVSFGLEFEALLRSCRHLRLLRAAFWHYHSYWFGQLDWFFGRKLPKALERLTKVRAPEESRQVHAMIEHQVREAQRAFERLCDGRYGKALNRWL